MRLQRFAPGQAIQGFGDTTQPLTQHAVQLSLAGKLEPGNACFFPRGQKQHTEFSLILSGTVKMITTRDERLVKPANKNDPSQAHANDKETVS